MWSSGGHVRVRRARGTSIDSGQNPIWYRQSTIAQRNKDGAPGRIVPRNSRAGVLRGTVRRLLRAAGCRSGPRGESRAGGSERARVRVRVGTFWGFPVVPQQRGRLSKAEVVNL